VGVRAEVQVRLRTGHAGESERANASRGAGEARRNLQHAGDVCEGAPGVGLHRPATPEARGARARARKPHAHRLARRLLPPARAAARAHDDNVLPLEIPRRHRHLAVRARRHDGLADCGYLSSRRHAPSALRRFPPY